MAVRLFIGNLPYGASEADLRAHFALIAEPTHVVMPVDRETGRPRGFAFVEMANDGEGDSAINALNGRDLDGRTINVNEARPKTERSGGGFGGGRERQERGGYGRR